MTTPAPGRWEAPEFLAAPWSLARVWDLMKHLPVPLIVIGTAGTAGLIRILRSSLSDELSRQYVITARAKGVDERRILFKYPVRIAINPIISAIGYLLPGIVSGEALVSIVLSLPTISPMLLDGLRQQDMYLASSIITSRSGARITLTTATLRMRPTACSTPWGWTSATATASG